MNPSRNTMLAREGRRKTRGAVLTAFVLTSAALFALAAVGVDTGRLALTGGEVQTVADSAATAGAKGLLENNGLASAAQSQALAVVAENRVNGVVASIAPGQVEVGQYNVQTGTFTVGTSQPNAVRATPSVTVQNLFAGVLGASFRNTTVTKTATAAFSGVGKARPTLPLVIGDCDFRHTVSCYWDPECLPRLTQSPSGSDNTAWTSFYDGATGKNNIEKYLPGACGGSQPAPELSIGSSINLSNGQVTPVLRDIQDCVNAGINKFLVPIVSCNGNFNQSSLVVGFATIIVDSVQTSGGSKGLTLHGIYEEAVGTPGGGTFGTYTVRLFK